MSLWFNQSKKGSTDNVSIFSEYARKLAVLESEFTTRNEFASDERKLRSKTSKEFVLYQDCGFTFANTQLFDLPLTIMREPDIDKLRFWAVFNHRSNIINDKSCLGNHAFLNGNPAICVAKNIQNKRHSIRLKPNATADNSFIRIENSTTLNNLGRFSFSMWLYPTSIGSAGQRRAIISKGFNAGANTLNNGGFVIYLENGAFKIRIRDNAGNYTIAVSPATVTIDKFFNLFVTLSRTHLNLYFNSVLSESIPLTVENVTLANTDPIIIGGISSGNFEGYIDDVIFWRTTIESEEIEDYYDFGIMPSKEITSVWGFDEGDFSADARIVDSWGYNAGVIQAIGYFEYSDTIVKPRLNISVEDQVTTNTDTYVIDEIINDGVSANRRIGSRMDGEAYFRVPERTEDFRIDSDHGGLFHFYIAMLTRDFSRSDAGRVRQILFFKVDDEFLENYYVCQLDTTGRICLQVRYNDISHRYRSEKPLQMAHFYQISIGINLANIVDSGTAVSSQVNLFVNGRQERFDVDVTPEDLRLFTNRNPDNEVSDFDFLIGSNCDGLAGKQKNEIYEMRLYHEYPTFALHDGLFTNKTTTDNIPRARVLRVNESTIFETPPKTREMLKDDKEGYSLSDNFVGAIEGDMLANALGGTIELTSDFRANVGGTNTSVWSVEFFGDNDHVDIPRIRFQKEFTISAWVKYKGKDDGRWAGVFTNLDGLRNGNRLLLNGDEIRYHGQFYNDNERWDDWKVTVPNYEDEWHHFLIRYDGDERDKFQFWFDGAMIKEFRRKGSVQAGDTDEIWVGKGERRGYYLIGNIDDLFFYNGWLSDEDVQKLYRHEDVTANEKAIYRWERNAKDTSEDGDNDGELRHDAEFSTDVPP
jgi:hypothetical protein